MLNVRIIQDGTVWPYDSPRHIVELNIFHDQCSVSSSIARIASGCHNGHFDIAEPTIKKSNGTCRALVLIHLNAYTAACEEDALVRPAPVPWNIDGYICIEEPNVPRGVLLVAEYSRLTAAIKVEVVQQPARAFLDEQARVIITRYCG